MCTRKAGLEEPVSRNVVPLDFVDVDPNYHVLREFFPGFQEDKIIDALEYAGGDLNKASEYLITNMANVEDVEVKHERLDFKSEDFKVLSLVEMFPEIDVKKITAALKETNYDIEMASEILLNQEFIENFNKELRLEGKSKATVQETNKAWASINDEVSNIMSLTEIDSNLAKSYHHKNSRNMAYTLVDIIYTQRRFDEEEKLAKQRAKARECALPKGGRVQIGKPTRVESNAYNLLKEDGIVTNENNYTFHEDNPEVAELASLMTEDPRLTDISWEFHEQSLTYFKGDVRKCINLAIAIAELPNGYQATYKHGEKFKFPPKNEIANKPVEKLEKFVKVQSFKNSHKNVRLNDDLDELQYKYRQDQLLKAKRDNKLDLHRFHVQNAKTTTLMALEEWWNDELKAREINGRSGGAKATETDQFIIVTGKGIHSDGGVSKIRQSIKALLARSRYFYIEEGARFVVIGLKKSN